MKPCGGCAKRREMIKAAMRKVVGAKPKPVEPEQKPQEAAEPDNGAHSN